MGRTVIDGCHEAIWARLDRFGGIYGASSAKPSADQVASLVFFFRRSQLPERKTRLNGSKPPPGTHGHRNNAM